MYLTTIHTQEPFYERVRKLFNGTVLSEDEEKEIYKDRAFKMLTECDVINSEKLEDIVGYSHWDWFKKEYSDCIRAIDKDMHNYKGYD